MLVRNVLVASYLPITPTCLPCKVHSSMCGYIQVPANCCFSQACSGSGPLSESDGAGYILAPEYHLGHLSSITGNSSFNTRRYQPFRCPCLAWIGHVHALLRMIPFCPHVISNCVVPMAFLFLPSQAPTHYHRTLNHVFVKHNLACWELTPCINARNKWLTVCTSPKTHTE